MRWRGRGAIPLCSGFFLAIAGCELTEVAAPASADVLVVEAVLRVGSARQYVILHRSLEGNSVRGEPGASVSVIDPHGERIVYEERDLWECLSSGPRQRDFRGIELSASCYASPLDRLYFVEPGGAYELEVRTVGGEVGQGRTVVPAAFTYRSPAVTLNPQTLIGVCSLPTRPFTLAWGRSEGSWSYVVKMEITGWADELRQMGIEAPDPIELTSVSVSAADTTLLFPTNIGLFQRGELDQRIFTTLRSGLPAGVAATLVVLANDRNYTNAIRGGQFNPSGNVRLPSVVGDATGLFGSVVPVVVRSTPDGPPCPEPLPPGS